MSEQNAHKKSFKREDVPGPDLRDLAFEHSLRRGNVQHTISMNRQGERCIGGIFPKQAKSEAEWEAELKDLSRQQGLSDEGHSLETIQARGRQDQPTASSKITSRTLRRRG